MSRRPASKETRKTELRRKQRVDLLIEAGNSDDRLVSDADRKVAAADTRRMSVNWKNGSLRQRFKQSLLD